MKKLLLILAFIGTANATGSHNPLTGSSQTQGQEQSQSANGGNSSTVVQGDDVTFPKIANSAIAPSVSTNVICPMISNGSKAFSVFFLSASGTTGSSINGLCVAYHLQQYDVVKQIACNENAEYKKAATQLGLCK